MNLILIQDFFADYSISSVIIAIIVGIATYFTSKIKTLSKQRSFLYLLHFFLSIALTFVYNLILGKQNALNLQTLSAGIMSGSLSLVIKVLLNKIINGEKLPNDKVSLLIAGLIDGYVKKDAIQVVISFVKGLLCGEESSATAEDDAINQIAFNLKQHSFEDYTDGDIFALACLIFASVKQQPKE